MAQIIIFALFAWIIYIFIKHEKNKTYIKTDTEYHKTESPIERRLYNGLINNGYYPSTQVKVGKYRIDIAFEYQKLAIECDGRDYHSSPKAKARDKRKDDYLRSQGWKVLRFTGSRIHRDLQGIIRRIDNELIKRQIE